MRLYTIKREYICSLKGFVCESITIPKCKSCDVYQDYKKSGLTVKKYLEKNQKQKWS